MIKIKKAIALILAIATFLSCGVAQVSATTKVNGTKIDNLIPETMYPQADGTIAKMQNVTYTSTSNAKIKYVVTTVGDAFVQIRNVNYGDGQYAMAVYGKGGGNSSNKGDSRISMFIGEKTADNKYVISFDATRSATNWQDYVALNEGGWNGTARLDDSSTQWTITDLDQSLAVNPDKYGQKANNWKHYEATLSTQNDPQIDFGVFLSENAMYVDNIVVKDTSGNVIFSENFEFNEENIYDPFTEAQYPSNETKDANHYKMQNVTYTSENNANMKYVVATAGDAYVMVMNANSDNNGGTKSLRIYGRGTNISGTNSSAKISMFLGVPQTENNQYVVSFDAYRKDGTWLDYVALNEGGNDGIARFDNENTQWTKTTLGAGYDAGYNVGEWSRYTATLTTMNAPQLNFSVNEYAIMFIDNIVVWDTAGNVIFREDFEVAEEQVMPEFPVNETYDPLPKSVYPSNETKDATHYKMQGTDLTYISDFDQSVKYVINTSGTTGSDSYAMMMNANSDTLGGKYAMRIYANSTNATSDNTKVSLHIGEKTADNKYIVSFDAYRNQDSKPEDYVALNGNGADGVARLDYADTLWSSTLLGAGYDAGYGVGEWSRYTAMLTTDSDDPRLDFSIAKYAVMFIDNIVVWDTAGNVIFRENFEPVEVDDMPEFPVIETYDPIPKSMYPYIKDGSIVIDKMQGTDLTYISDFDQSVKYVINTSGTTGSDPYAQVIDVNSNDNGGKYSLRLYGKHSDANTYAKISMYLGKQTANNRYVVSFDAARFDGNDKDYAALNGSDVGGTARLGDANCQWTKTALDNSKCYDPNNRKVEKSWDWNRYTSTLTAIDTSYLEFAVFGYGLMYIDNIAVWDTQGNLIFSEDFEISEGYALPEFPGVPEEPGVITVHDAVVERVEQVENEFVATGAAGILRPNTFIRASVKIENGTDEDTSSNVYTALYRDSVLVLFDSQTVYAAAGGEMTGCAILKIPSSLEDGEYKLKVFVWDDDFNALKNVKVLGE